MALGRGLGEILFEVEEAYDNNIEDMGIDIEAKGARVEDISVDEISPNPFQPRKHFAKESLIELKESIINHGLLQPIVVIEKSLNSYILVAGERRLRASKLANITHIKAIIADVEIDEIRLRELALIENIQRENLNVVELANSYSQLIEVHNITHEQLSKIVHKSRSQITNTMRLLSLSQYVQTKLIEQKISQGHAKVLVGLSEDRQNIITNSIIGQKLSVRETENLVKKYKDKENKSVKKPKTNTIFTNYMEEISSLVPFKHKIKDKSITISLDNEKDIQKFLTFFKKS